MVLMKIKIFQFFIVLAIILQYGCGSYIASSHSADFHSSNYYAGTRLDVSFLRVDALMPFILMDLPFSFVVDTFSLPYKAYHKATLPNQSCDYVPISKNFQSMENADKQIGLDKNGVISNPCKEPTLTKD